MDGYMMKKNMFQVAIIGSGQLGSRHLQGLALSKNRLKIYVVDPDENSLRVAKDRFHEIQSTSFWQDVEYILDMESLPKELDLVIIATTANIRRKVIESLLGICMVRYIVFEKVVFQKSEDFPAVKSLLDQSGTKAWVNCPRRSYPFYAEIKDELPGGAIKISLTGKNWGMACNSLHFIDLLAFLSGETTFSFNTSQLDNIVYPSKRLGFSELRGRLIVNSKQGDILELVDDDSSFDSPLIVISTQTGTYKIDETNALIQKKEGDLAKDYSIKLPFQSQLTGLLADDILNKGKSDLVSFEDCMKYHIPTLDALNAHFSKVLNQKVIECPIT